MGSLQRKSRLWSGTTRAMKRCSLQTLKITICLIIIRWRAAIMVHFEIILSNSSQSSCATTDVSELFNVSGTRAPRTWPSSAPPKCAVLESKWWRRWRRSTHGMKEGDTFTRYSAVPCVNTWSTSSGELGQFCALCQVVTLSLQEVEAPPWEIHDEQCTGKFHHPAGDNQQRHQGDAPLHRLRLRGVHFRARSSTSHLPTCQRLIINYLLGHQCTSTKDFGLLCMNECDTSYSLLKTGVKSVV